VEDGEEMSISIYYTARRSRPLSTEERAAVDQLTAKYAIEDQLEEFLRTGEGYNWESFCIYDAADPTEPGVVFEGATKLPDNSEDAFLNGLQHWCNLLSEIRRAVPDAAWEVNVDDHDIPWNELTQLYDPTT
jgi:hypothetical protein